MSGIIERVPPLRWTAAILGALGLHGRGLVIAVPLLWLLIFFLIPFLVVAKISLSEAAIARPPYLPLVEWDELRAIVTLNFGNFAYLFEDPLYLNAYLSSLKIAFVACSNLPVSSRIR
jgi:putrescine transport system permease protein